MDGGMNGWTDRRTDGRTDGRKDGRNERFPVVVFSSFFLSNESALNYCSLIGVSIEYNEVWVEGGMLLCVRAKGRRSIYQSCEQASFG